MASEHGGKTVRRGLAELTLIVMGVLIALYVENWAGQRQDRSTERDYLVNLSENLREDTTGFRIQVEQAEELAQSAALVLEVVESGNGGIEDPVGFVEAVEITGRFDPPVYTTQTFRDLIETGNLRLIENVPLRQELVRYYGDLENLGEFDELFRDRIWLGYFPHAVSALPMPVQRQLLDEETVIIDARAAASVADALRNAEGITFHLKNVIRTYILHGRFQTNTSAAAENLIRMIEAELRGGSV
jgi:hypothetical protein